MVSKSQKLKKTNPIAGERLAIGVKEARKLLGKDFKSMTDEQIEDIVIKLHLIAKGFVKSSVSI